MRPDAFVSSAAKDGKKSTEIQNVAKANNLLLHLPILLSLTQLYKNELYDTVLVYQTITRHRTAR